MAIFLMKTALISFILMRWQNGCACSLQQILAYFQQMFEIITLLVLRSLQQVLPSFVVLKKGHIVSPSLSQNEVRLTSENSPFSLCFSALIFSNDDIIHITINPKNTRSKEGFFRCDQSLTIPKGENKVISKSTGLGFQVTGFSQRITCVYQSNAYHIPQLLSKSK